MADSPGMVFIVGALILALLPGRIRTTVFLLIPLIAIYQIFRLHSGMPDITGVADSSVAALASGVELFGYRLTPLRVDKLSLVFAYTFGVAAFASAVYAAHLKKADQHIAAYLYVGSALGVVFAGDLITLFLYWEVMAVASTYLIWARRSKESDGAGFRYILVHLAGGLLLFAGIVIHVVETGSIAFNFIGLDGLATWLILLGFCLNAAVPPLSAWISDAYPEATVTGAVFLSAFTTKTAVYVLLRGFPGTELLIWVGAIMAFYGTVYALLANDARRILAYSIISQIGFMVCGAGIGTELAINGAAAHASAHIIYKGLLFMGAGAVLQMTGKSDLTDLGGLYRTMPITLFLFMIGALSISGFPLFSGFVSKSMVITASESTFIVYLLLKISSTGTFLHTGLKLPYFIWFGKDSGLRPKEPPKNMIAAMTIPAIACITVGVYPQLLYNILPFTVDYHPYTAYHVIGDLQYLMFTALIFFVMLKFILPSRVINLDTDWFYRKGATAFLYILNGPFARTADALRSVTFRVIPGTILRYTRPRDLWEHPAPRYTADEVLPPAGHLEDARELAKKLEDDPVERDYLKIHGGHSASVSGTLFWVTAFLLLYLVMYYI